MFKRSSLTYLFLFAIDLSLTLLALRLAKFLRETAPLGSDLLEPLRFSPWLYLSVPVIWIVTFMALKVYNPARALRYTEDLSSVWVAVMGASLIFAGVSYLLFRELSRLLFLYFFILDITFLSAWRRLLPQFPGLARRLYGADQRRVLIVGALPVSGDLARALTKYSPANLTLVGFVTDEPDSLYPPTESGPTRPGQEAPKNYAGYPILGTINDVPRLVEQYRLQEVIFALPPTRQADLRSLVMALQMMPVNLRMVPDVFDLIFLRASVEEIEGIPLIGLREPVIEGLDRLIKRLFDLMVSILLLIILMPVMLIIAFLIKLDSPGPVLFGQQRVGEGGHLFWMVKFRTMYQGAEKQEMQLLQTTADNELFFAKHPHDPRITRLGRFLRRTSLDELPQLFNVLKGEMSLVGPRPELPWLVEKYKPWQRKRFAVPQGMTGWWQVNGRMERADPYQRVEDDLFYIKNYSLWLDLRILWRTIQAIIQGEGAY